ncbi:MAG: VCBS repeat-containing protein [Candidatus Marinimicrobia bacterium]|nr:VCBS repeat-containing protein [Candidatus Neomarinimicrobiota bacterium]
MSRSFTSAFSLFFCIIVQVYPLDNSRIQMSREPYAHNSIISTLRDCTSTVIYPWEVDTTRYDDMYIEIQQLDLYVGEKPFVTGDTDGDGLMEIYGMWVDPTLPAAQRFDSFRNRIYEMGADSLFHLQHVYPAVSILPLGITDVDNDGLNEYYLDAEIIQDNTAFRPIRAYECSTSTSLPTVYQHSYLLPGSQWMNWMTWDDLDNDNQTDLLLFDKAVDTSATDRMAVIQEYDTTANEYIIRHTFEYPDFISTGFTVGDLDQDGLKEYYISGVHGSVSMVEYSGIGDQYVNTWNGSVGTLNAFGSTISPDLDGNGRPELWVFGQAFYDNRTAMLLTGFEAVGDNILEPVSSVWLMDNFGISIPQIQCIDMDNDGEMELFLNISSNLLILEHQGDLSFYLGFIQRKPLFGQNSAMYSASAVDIDFDGYPEILASVDLVNGQYTYPQEFVFIYKYNSVSTLGERTLPQQFNFSCYPNPFNPSTSIEYELPKHSEVSLVIYDIVGREIQTLVSTSQTPGRYQVSWNGADQFGQQVAGGMYFARLQAGEFSSVVKMVYLR